MVKTTVGLCDELSVRQKALVRRNMGLAGWMVNRCPWAVRILGREDAEAATYLGLVEGARHWEPARGRFATAAYWWMRSALSQACRQANFIHTPHSGSGNADVPTAKNVLRFAQLGVEDREYECSRVQDEQQGPDLRRLVEDGLARMRPRLRQVLRCRFFEQQTLQETGERLGISKERVRQLQERALQQLHGILRRSGVNQDVLEV